MVGKIGSVFWSKRCDGGDLEDAAHRGETCRRLDAPEFFADVASGVAYVNGVRAVNRRDDQAPSDLIYTLLHTS